MARMHFLTIVGYLFIAAGTAVIVVSCWSAVRAVQSRKWPECSGTVMTSALEQTHGSEGDLYRAAISYRYVIGSNEFVGRRVRFCDRLSFSWSSPAARIVNAYSAGTAVAVHYDPDDPNESVLEPGINSFIISGGFLGALFLVMGFFAVFDAA